MYKQYVEVSYDECLKYVRKSRSDDPMLTLEEVLKKQDMELNEFSERVLGGVIPASQTYREVASSETIENRPEMCKLLKAIESKSVRAVLVREIERLSRGDLIDAGTIIKIFSLTNTLIITPTEMYDLQNESDRMIVEMKLKSGNQYLEYSKKVMKRGKDLASMSGEFIAKSAPYGYEKMTYKEGRRNIKTLKIVPEQAKVVELIFHSYADEGMSMLAIADMLTNAKFAPISGDKWSRYTIADMLVNPVYMGKIRWNYRTNVKSWENQQTVVSRPRKDLNDCMLVDGLHEAIISEELFYKAHNRRSQNVPLKKSNELKNPLAGIFYCAKCGRAMKLRAECGKNQARFECSDMKYCGNASANYSDVMTDICKSIEDYLEDFEVKASNDNSDELERHAEMVETLERRLSEIENKELSLWDKYAEEGMPKQVFDKLIEKVTKDKAELKELLADTRNTMPRQEDYEEKICTLRMALRYIQDESVSAATKNTYLRTIIEKITFKREKGVLLTKELAKEMNVPYPHPLCYHHYPYELNIIPQV